MLTIAAAAIPGFAIPATTQPATPLSSLIKPAAEPAAATAAPATEVSAGQCGMALTPATALGAPHKLILIVATVVGHAKLNI
jgi:hypothetical protein